MQMLLLGTWEILLIVLIVLLLFGAKRIPELMKGLGKGVKSFKDGMNGVDEKNEPNGDLNRLHFSGDGNDATEKKGATDETK